MHVLIVNNTVIPAKDYGGVERIIWWLGKELVRMGHTVSYLVAPGSGCPFAEVYALDKSRPLASQIPDDVDVIHFCFQSKERFSKPYLMMHQFNEHTERELDINSVFASQNQAERYSCRTFVHNGIDPDDMGPVNWNIPRQRLLFLGWASRPEKNLKDCLAIARRTGHVLSVVGGKDKWFKRRPWVRYHGFIGDEAKKKVMSECKALLFPVRWHEPCAVALFESLYFGMPVFGSRHGCLPELIKEHLGFLSNSRSELIQAVEEMGRFDPREIHRYTCDVLSAKAMARNYLALYEKVMNGETLNATPPINPGNFSRDNLLPFYS